MNSLKIKLIILLASFFLIVGPAIAGTYSCGKCGLTIGSKATPNGAVCPRGGAHQWHKLN
jgi:hypothetical protein